MRGDSVGYKTDYRMYSMDFEEFLWAKGYGYPDITFGIKLVKGNFGIEKAKIFWEKSKFMFYIYR